MEDGGNHFEDLGLDNKDVIIVVLPLGVALEVIDESP